MRLDEPPEQRMREIGISLHKGESLGGMNPKSSFAAPASVRAQHFRFVLNEVVQLARFRAAYFG